MNEDIENGEKGSAKSSAKAFSQVLIRLRKEAGFHSAYSFYHGNGGSRNFPFTYVHYLRIERAGQLPRPQWMRIILRALRLTPGEARCREAFLAYLRDTLKTEEAFNLIVGPLISDRQGSAPDDGGPMRWMKAAHSVHLTPEQFEVIASDEPTYWCSEVLCNDSGTWTPENMARTLDLAEKAVRASLKRLAGCGLAQEVSKGRFRIRETGKLYTFPGRLPGMEPLLKKIQGYWEAAYKKKGKPVAERVELIRTEPADIQTHFIQLAQTMDSANLLARHEKGRDTGLYLIESRIRRLRDF